eukprot:scaffold138265_cov22-Prasinocladus_malaysianus.AAC.1
MPKICALNYEAGKHNCHMPEVLEQQLVIVLVSPRRRIHTNIQPICYALNLTAINIAVLISQQRRYIRKVSIGHKK